MRFSANKGFTLVELMIGVAIISVLVVALMSYIDPIAQFNKAKDTKRVADLDQVKKALDLYYNDTGCYPATPPPFGQRWVNSDNANTIYMETVPQDPQGGAYDYIHQPAAGTKPCPQWYVLYAHLAKQATSDSQCRIDPHDTNIANCAPSDYVSSSDFYSCKTSGNVACGTTASTVGTAGTGMRCRNIYCDADGDGHYTSTTRQICSEGTPIIPTGCTLTAPAQGTADCNDDPLNGGANIWQSGYCFADGDGDLYTSNVGTSYCGIQPANCAAVPSQNADCDDTDADKKVNRLVYATSPPQCTGSPSTSLCTVISPTPIPAAHLGTQYSTTLTGQNTLCVNTTTKQYESVCTGSGGCPTGYSAACDTGAGPCPGPTPQAGSTCTDFQSSNSNCGGCGVVCSGSLPFCVSGVCSPPPLVNIDGVAGGHQCVQKRTGEVKCWGNNSSGELGDGTTTTRTTPVSVLAGGAVLTGATAINVSNNASCAISSGTVKCWGNNANGKLGDGTTTNRSTAVSASLPSTAISVNTGAGHTCAVLSTGSVYCWGKNNSGQLGNGTTNNSNVPVAVSSITNAAAVTVGELHSCALLTTGGVKCWGYNADGQLGNGTTTNSSTPTAISFLANVTKLDAGKNHTCAVLSDGTVQCWGVNALGQLGTGSLSPATSTTPLTVASLANVATINASGEITCVTLNDKTAKCWGDNHSNDTGGSTCNLGNNGCATKTWSTTTSTCCTWGQSCGTKYCCPIWGPGACHACGSSCTSVCTAYCTSSYSQAYCSTASIFAPTASYLQIGGVCGINAAGTGVSCWGQGVCTPATVSGLL